MVGRRRDFKQRATLRRSLAPRDSQESQCDPLGGPCDVWDSFCRPPNTSPGCCSNLMFILDSACLACTSANQNQTWEEYNHGDADGKCGPSPVSAPPLPPTTASNAVPQWATVMAFATPTPDVFHFADAVSINDVLHKNPSSFNASPSTSATITTTTQSTTATSVSSSDGPTSIPNPTSSQPSQTSSQPKPTSVQSSSSVPLELFSKASSQAPVGAIVGGIIGALVLLGLVGIWYMRRRRRGHPMAPSAAYKAALRAGNQSPSPYQAVHNDSPNNSTDDLTEERRPTSWLSSRPVSIHSESRFHEHTSS
ncbi:hypothetical protein B0H12DRAFT_1092219 [Mycena haematopus]|nr:hypothetical protein B0H12DRAFT_1092219 [Mycena haematopus]